ncbi:MAG: right-handed parallel beta-helix repeat-containing protein [Dehalococcoidia bacterium]
MYRVLSVGIAAVAAVLLVLGSGARPVEAATTVLVFSTADSGPGTFRAAIDQANNNSNVGYIRFLTNGPITLQDPVVYEGSQPLTLAGLFNTVIQGQSTNPVGNTDLVCNVDDDEGLFESNGGADLTLVSLTFQNNPCGNGVYVYLYGDEDVSITLNRVAARNNDEDGVRIEEDSGCDRGTNINLTVTTSTFSGNGDDGLEINDEGDGDVTASLRFSAFRDNGEDGFDIYEECDGDVSLTTLSSTFNDNGWDEEDGEGIDVDEYGSGYVEVTLNGLDASRNTDDGVDIEEYDGSYVESVALQREETDSSEVQQSAATDGPQTATCEGDNLTLTVNGGRASDNGSDGFEVDEEDCGSLYMTVTAVVASGNDDDGFDAAEYGPGDLDFTAGSATAADNNGHDDEDGNGFELHEQSYGALNVDLTSVAARYNGGFEESGDGIDLEEFDNGDLNLNMGLSVVLSNFEDGVDAEEYGCGTLDATLLSSTVSLNADDGIDAEQEYDCGDPDGELTLIFTSVVANLDEDLELDGVVLN